MTTAARYAVLALWIFFAACFIGSILAATARAEPYDPFDIFGPPEPGTPCVYLPAGNVWLCPPGVTPPDGRPR